MRIAPFLVAGLLLPTCAFAVSPTSESRKEVLVRCDMGETIGRALAKLDKSAANTLKVSGTCQENVLIQGFDDLKIVAKPGATLVPVPPTTAHAIEVSAARAVSIEGLTIRQTEDRTAMFLAACDDCRLKNVTVDGGIGLYAVAASQVLLSRFTMSGAGGWTAIGAWHAAYITLEDSVLDGGPLGEYGWGRWCGVCIGENATANIYRSVVRHFGVGVNPTDSANINVMEGTSIEDNACAGVQALGGAHVNIRQGVRVSGNASRCWLGGINVDGSASLSIDNTEVTGNTGGGIKLNHLVFAQIGAGTVVSSSIGPGLEARNLSVAVAGGDSSQPIVISGNQSDLRCDSVSHINNAARITGATQVNCANLSNDDDPDTPNVP